MQKKNYILKLGGNLEFYYSKKLNKFYVLGKFGVSVFYMPSLFLMKNLNFIFLSRFFFFSFIKHLFTFVKKVIKIFFFRVYLKGLGYKIRSIKSRILKFFFGWNFFFYLYLPIGVFFRRKGKAISVFSANKQKLNVVLYNLISLKKFDYYERNNMFIIRHKIIYFKKRK